MFCKMFHHTICFGFFFRVSSFVLFLYHRSVATPFFYNLVIFCPGIGSFFVKCLHFGTISHASQA
jgi:hypothetical protein